MPITTIPASGGGGGSTSDDISNESLVTGTTVTDALNSIDTDISGFVTDSELTTALASKENTITATTSADYYRGDKTFATLNKTAVGLSNVANTDTTNASNISSGSLSDSRLSANVTLEGNTFGGNNQLLKLDSGGKVPSTNLPNSVMQLQGSWNASTNTPTLADGVGNIGDVYEVTVAGSQNLGSGTISFALGDWVIYGASGVWYESPNSNLVMSVNGQTGTVVLTASDLSLGNVDNTSDATKNSASVTLTNKTFNSTTNVFTIRDGSLTLANTADFSKAITFSLSNITAGNTRSVTFPDASVYLNGLATSGGVATAGRIPYVKADNKGELSTSASFTYASSVLALTTSGTAAPLNISNSASGGSVGIDLSMTSATATGSAIQIGTNTGFSGKYIKTYLNGVEKFSILSTGQINSASLTASTIIYSDASKNIVSLANGTGVLTNNGSGTLTWGTATSSPVTTETHTTTTQAITSTSDTDINVLQFTSGSGTRKYRVKFFIVFNCNTTGAWPKTWWTPRFTGTAIGNMLGKIYKNTTTAGSIIGLAISTSGDVFEDTISTSGSNFIAEIDLLVSVSASSVIKLQTRLQSGGSGTNTLTIQAGSYMTYEEVN